MRIFNGGDVVEQEVDVSLLRYEQDPVEAMVQAIRDAAKDLTGVHFEARVQDDPYGGFGSHYLTVTGRPTGDLAAQAKAQVEREAARSRAARVAQAKQVLAEAEAGAW